MSKILVVEDDRPLAASVAATLESNADREVETAYTLDRAYQAVDNSQYELIILDWLLTDGEGIELIAYLTDYSFQTKVLMLTQKKRIKNKLEAFQLGVDDYLPKPFNSQELMMRCQVLLKRFKLSSEDVIKRGNLTISSTGGYVVLGQKRISLPAKELEILKILAINSPRVISKQKLISQIWTELDSQPQSNTIEVYVRRIRMKLGRHSLNIKTKRGFGYFYDCK